MGKKLVIKGADFSANGINSYSVDYEDYQLRKGSLNVSTHQWGVPTGNDANMFILVSIPENMTKMVIDATSMKTTTHGKTAVNSTPTADPIYNLLSGQPDSITHETVETKWLSGQILTRGSSYEIDLPSTAKVLVVHTGYWTNIGGTNQSFNQSRLPNSISFHS